MPTIKQIEANRRNSQQSTGPRTAAGKAVSRGNAMRTGIYAESLAIRGERPGDLEQLTAEYFREWDPVTPRERDLVDTIVRNEWILRRMGLVEAELWNHYFKTTDVTQPGSRWDVIKRDFMLGQGFIAIGANLERLQRRISSVERSSARARAELSELRDQRASEAAQSEDRGELSPEPAVLTALNPDPQPLTPANGFVPSLPVGAGHARPGATEPFVPAVCPPTNVESQHKIGFVPPNTGAAAPEDRAEASLEPEPTPPESRAPNPAPPNGFVPPISAEAAA